MNRASSLLHDLTRRLTLIGGGGGAALTALLVIDFDRWRESHALVLRHWADVDDLELVILLSFAAILVPLILAARRAIRNALAPLRDSVAVIDAATQADRGFRLSLADLPVEVAGYGDAINRLIERLETVAVEREAFAAQAAHELKHPLAELLLDVEAIEGEAALRLKQDVNRFSRLLDQLLVMARLQAHAANAVTPAIVDLAELAENVVAAEAPAAIAAGRHLAFAVEEPARCRGHVELIETALRNLVENAVRVTPRGGTVTVTVGAGARLSVADEGPGLSTEELTQLCRPFAQSRLANSHGAGLGLAISDKVARLHGGSLTTDRDARAITLSLPQNLVPD